MLSIGQIVYVKKIENAARNCSIDRLVTEETISKVGIKYFYLDNFTRYKFSIENMKNISEISSDYKVYMSKQEIDDESELDTKNNKIRVGFGYGLNDLDKVRKIYNIIFDK